MTKNMEKKPWRAIASRTWDGMCKVVCLAAVTGLAACGNYAPYERGDVPHNAQLALSPTGKHLLVSWHDDREKLRARMLYLKGTRVVSMRDIALPKHTLTTAFGVSDEQLLVTTWDGKKHGALLRLDLDGQVVSKVHEGTTAMRFPVETSDGGIVVLEGLVDGNGLSRWRRHLNGESTWVHPKGFTMASGLQIVDDSLFLLIPWASFMTISGRLPEGLDELRVQGTWRMSCADRLPLTCVRHRFFLYKNSPPSGDMQVIEAGKVCSVPGRLHDLYELAMSRDGRTVVFHAADGHHYGPHRVYVMRATASVCRPVAVALHGGKSYTGGVFGEPPPDPSPPPGAMRN